MPLNGFKPCEKGFETFVFTPRLSAIASRNVCLVIKSCYCISDLPPRVYRMILKKLQDIEHRDEGVGFYEC